VQLDTQLHLWCWREVLHGPRILERALRTLQRPTDLAVSLQSGLAWHLTAFSFLVASAKITEILSTSPRPRLLQASLSQSYTVTGISQLQFLSLLDLQHFAIPPLSRRNWVPL